MAIVINTAPDGGALYAAYVSQFFEVQDTVPTGQTPAALQVTVKNNGVAVETLYYPAIEVVTGSPKDTCIFRLDIQEIAQRLFSPVSLLPGVLGGSHNQTFNDEVLFLSCDFQTWLPDANNLLVLGEAVESSVAYRCVNAVMYMDEEPQMGPYYYAIERKWLTNKPLNGWTDERSNEFLYVYNPDSTDWYWIFEFRDAAGTLKSKLRADNSNQDNRIMSKGVGGANVIATSWDSIIFSDGDPNGNGIVPGVAYYEVYGSSSTTGATPITEVRRYYIADERCVKYRVHFLNKLGAWDYFPILSEPNDVVSMQNDPYETTMPEMFSEGATRAHVRNRGQVRADDGIEVEVAGFSPKQAAWLQELAVSPKAFIEKTPRDNPTQYRLFPIVIRNTKFNRSDRTFTFDAIYSREIISQRS
jgi:hypothetical protein